MKWGHWLAVDFEKRVVRGSNYEAMDMDMYMHMVHVKDPKNVIGPMATLQDARATQRAVARKLTEIKVDSVSEMYEFLALQQSLDKEGRYTLLHKL